MSLDARKTNLAYTQEKIDFVACEQQRRRSACASAQSDGAFAIYYLESLVVKHALYKISIF